MKLFVVIVVCFGIALAYNLEDDCKSVDNEIGRVVKNTRASATALMLWSMRKILGMFLSLPISPRSNVDLRDTVTAMEESYQISQAVARMLEIFDYQINKDTNIRPGNVPKKVFQSLETAIENTVIDCETFAVHVTNASKSNKLSTPQAKKIISSGHAMYLQTNKAMLPFISFSPNYKLAAIATFENLVPKLDAVLTTLQKSAFGESLLLFMRRFKLILERLNYLFMLTRSELTSVGGENDKEIVHQFVIIKLHDAYALNHLYETISCVESYLETAAAATIAQLSLPENHSLLRTCASLDRSFTMLRNVLSSIKLDLEQENVSYPEIINGFLANIFELEPIRSILDKQFLEILKALQIPMDDDFRSTKAVTEFVRSGLQQDRAEYNIRRDYNNSAEQIDKKCLQNWNHVILLTRLLWRNFARELLTFSNDNNSTYEINDVLANIIEGLKLADITAYLTELPTISSQQIMIEFDTLNSFEKAAAKFFAVLKTVHKKNDPRKVLDEEANNVYCTIQYILYQLNAASAADKSNSALEAATEESAGLMDLLNKSTSHSRMREAIKPVVTMIQDISLAIKRLLDLQQSLSKDPEENRNKRAVLQSTVAQLTGTCNFEIAIKGLLYVANFLNTYNETDLDRLNYEALTDALSLIQKHWSHRQDIMGLIEKMCAGVAPVEKALVDRISLRIRRLNGDHRILSEQIRAMVCALPHPSKEKSEFVKLIKAYKELIGPFELPSLIQTIDVNEEDDEIPIVQSGELIPIQIQHALDSTEQWVRSLNRMKFSRPDEIAESGSDEEEEVEVAEEMSE